MDTKDTKENGVDSTPLAESTTDLACVGIVDVRDRSWSCLPRACRRAAILHQRGDAQLVMLGIDCVALRDFAGSETANLGDELPAVPFRFAVDLRVLVLDLLAVGREPRRAAVRARQHDHRVGLRDREMIRRGHDAAHRVARTRHRLAVHLGSAAEPTAPAASPKSAAAPSTTPAAAPEDAATGTVAGRPPPRPLRRRV